MPDPTVESSAEPNAQHAREFAAVTKEEVAAELRRAGAAAARVVRELSDEQLERTGTVLGREWRAREPITGPLIGHVRNHLEGALLLGAASGAAPSHLPGGGLPGWGRRSEPAGSIEEAA